MDTYQAVYDATRQALRCDPERAISEAVSVQIQRLAYAIDIVQQEASVAAYQHARPSAVYRPTLMMDGNAWLAMYGDLPTGVTGSGSSPEEAMADFDKKWHEKSSPPDAGDPLARVFEPFEKFDKYTSGISAQGIEAKNPQAEGRGFAADSPVAKGDVPNKD